ncbi:RHS repeat protein [Mucilaginibacter sp. SG564]|uniref:RHS repeat protein n=1 Tax=Mucilaginibacter sp. SG564 TaxID=2587022 RepID=UPI001557AFCA|nr:RHS repeat protein [Mucilaginibacter sp. SG564]NOW94689.1 YD repeat-containing protein [Mucilaginibacter sp. SG564]
MLLFIIAFYTKISYAQTSYNKLPVIIPVAPNAAELSKYGGLDVGLQTGSLNFRVPLFNIDGLQWDMPVDIQYATTGIKVDQIASRVGIGWALNAGGVVTRSVNGKPDDWSTGSTLPYNWQAFDQNLLTYLQNVTLPGPGGSDSEPDEFNFNFNGYSGKFVLGLNGAPVLIPYSNLKVTVTFNSTSSSSIVFTTPDGSQYYFEDVEYTSTSNDCTGNVGQVGADIATSWYLSRVILPNKEQVSFTYQNIAYNYVAGFSQTMTKSLDLQNENPCPALQCAKIDNQATCFNQNYVAGKLLTNISFRELSADFTYVDRMDLPSSSPNSNSEKLLSTITLNNNGNKIKAFHFVYDYGVSSTNFLNPESEQITVRYRPFLTSVYATGKNEETAGKHYFTYNDKNGLPPRLSYAQDMFGFFNGKYNSSFIPKPDATYDQQLFWRATADRGADLTSTLKGVLTRVDYPTGGSDSIVYALNDYHTTQSPTQSQSVSLSIPKTDSAPIIKASPSFTPGSPNGGSLSGNVLVEMNADGSSPYDPNTDLLTIEIIHVSDGVSVYTKALKAGQGFTGENITVLLAGSAYTLKITSLVPNIKCSAVLSYQVTLPPIDVNVTTSGLRVSKLITRSAQGVPIIKNYYYADVSNLSKSSGVAGRMPNLFSSEFIFNGGGCDFSTSQSAGHIAIYTCTNRVAHSNSLINSYSYSQNYIYYGTVIEGLGDDFSGGGTQHTYIINRDGYSVPLHGPAALLGVKLTNNGFGNGLEKEQLIFKKQDGLFYNLKRTVNSYKIDTTVNNSITAYIITKYTDYPAHTTPPQYVEFEGFQIDKYKFYSAWTYKDTTTVYDYFPNNGVAISKTDYTYANPLHTMLTKSRTLNSDNKISEVIYKYPHEIIAEGRDITGVYRAMINDQVIQPVIEEQQITDSKQTAFTRINYYQPNLHQYYPQTIAVQGLNTTPLETRIHYYNYDNQGNVQSVAKEQGAKLNYLWSYNGHYPVAEIKNVDYGTIESLLGAANISTFKAKPNPSKSEIDSFLAPIKNGLQLKNAQVTTYTYDPLVGMTSSTDPKGETTYYEYDGFQRLMNVKDKDGNIVKHLDYHYQGQ